jgi:hypothetical protein
MYRTMCVDLDGHVFTANKDFYQIAVEQSWDRYKVDTIFGTNKDVDTSGEDVWNGGGLYTGQPVGFTPETVEVLSSSADDAAAGTGARTVRITGLKSNASTLYETETIVLNGVTPVASVSTWWRVTKAQVLTAGSGGANAGSITIRASATEANIFAVISIGYNYSHNGVWTVPAGFTAYAKRVRLTMARATGANGDAEVSARIRPPGSVYAAPLLWRLTQSTIIEFTAVTAVVLPAGTDVKFRAESVSNAGTIVEAAAEFLLRAA